MTDPSKEAADILPLNVRAAVALGWTHVFESEYSEPACDEDGWYPSYRRGWRGNPPGKEVPPAGPMVIPIPDFEHDWSATGPLIEKNRICIDFMASDGTWCAEETYVIGGGRSIRRAWSKNPLAAVCLLILALAEAGRLEER